MREVDRVEVIREVLGRRMRQGEASERLGICVRQVKRLVRRYREEGARRLRSRRRGRRASNGIAPELRREIVGVVRERYEDFAPTLAWEKLTEVHGYGVSVDAHPHRRRKKPLPYHRQGPLPPAQTPSLQTLPRPPLESLGSPPPSPFHPYPIATPASSRSSRPPEFIRQ